VAAIAGVYESCLWGVVGRPEVPEDWETRRPCPHESEVPGEPTELSAYENEPFLGLDRDPAFERGEAADELGLYPYSCTGEVV